MVHGTALSGGAWLGSRSFVVASLSLLTVPRSARSRCFFWSHIPRVKHGTTVLSLNLGRLLRALGLGSAFRVVALRPFAFGEIVEIAVLSISLASGSSATCNIMYCSSPSAFLLAILYLSLSASAVPPLAWFTRCSCHRYAGPASSFCTPPRLSVAYPMYRKPSPNPCVHAALSISFSFWSLVRSFLESYCSSRCCCSESCSACVCE